MTNQPHILGIIGLAYVGLPMAEDFGKTFDTLGFYINSKRIADLKAGVHHIIEVMMAAGAIWHFLPFRPGFVGGHCIGVDAFYLAHKAETLSYHSKVILVDRDINDNRALFAASKLIHFMIKQGQKIEGSCVLVLGITFKRNCPDTRNSMCINFVREIQDFVYRLTIADLLSDLSKIHHEYALISQKIFDQVIRIFNAILVAASHWKFKAIKFDNFLNNKNLLLIIERLSPRALGQQFKRIQGSSRKLKSFAQNRVGNDCRNAVVATRVRQGLSWLAVESFRSELENIVTWHVPRNRSAEA